MKMRMIFIVVMGRDRLSTGEMSSRPLSALLPVLAFACLLGCKGGGGGGNTGTAGATGTGGTGNAPGVARITTVEAMKAEAERFYEGLMSSWKEVPSGAA